MRTVSTVTTSQHARDYHYGRTESLLPAAFVTDNFRFAKVYDWQDYRDVCYQMYINERKVS